MNSRRFEILHGSRLGPIPNPSADLRTVFADDFENGAILNHLNLEKSDATILHVGCGPGAFVMEAYKVLRALTDGPIQILGVDSSQDAINQARQNLKSAMSRLIQPDEKRAMRDAIQFRRIDAAKPSLQHKITTLFPRGISVIVAINVIVDVAESERRAVVRHWVEMLRSGGRVAFNSHGDPIDWGTAHLRDADPDPGTHIASINLAPPNVYARLHQETAAFYGQLKPNCIDFALRAPACTEMHEVLQSFAQTAALPSLDPVVLVNSQTTFHPDTGQVRHSPQHPRGPVIIADSSRQFLTFAMRHILSHYPPNTENEAGLVEQIWRRPRGLGHTLDELIDWSTGSEMRAPLMASWHIYANHDGIVAPHGISRDTYSCHVSGSSVLVVLERRV